MVDKMASGRIEPKISFLPSESSNDLAAVTIQYPFDNEYILFYSSIIDTLLQLSDSAIGGSIPTTVPDTFGS